MAWIEATITLVGIVVANYGVKLGRAYPLIKQAQELITAQYEARKDGKLTKTEKVILYDDIEEILLDAYDILKGLTPFRSRK